MYIFADFFRLVILIVNTQAEPAIKMQVDKYYLNGHVLHEELVYLSIPYIVAVFLDF